MAAFSYNSYSGENAMSQYRRYLQNQNYVDQIDNAIRETGAMNTAIVAIKANQVRNAIESSSEKQREIIIQTSNAICSTLEKGFADLYSNLESINDGIHGMSNLIGQGFSLLIEGQKITHKYLGQIQNLLRIPDSQKQRVYHIDEGMKYLRNAFRENSDSDFYTDALEEFKKSEEIEKKDFFSLYYIGLIYLKSNKHLDPKASETYFRNSARYYLAEAFVAGTNVSNNLLQNHREFHLEASEAYLFAAEACYIQGKYPESVALASEAWKTSPELTKAGLMQSKYLAANNQTNEAVKILENLITMTPAIAMEVLDDRDLNSKQEITDLLERFRNEALNEARKLYEFCINVLLINSKAKQYLESIDNLIKLETFLEAIEAINLLNAPKKWTINEGASISSKGEIMGEISSQEFNGSVVEFVKFERKSVLGIPKAKLLIQKASLNNEITGLQSQIKGIKYDLHKRWKEWGVQFFIWALAFVLGIAFSGKHGAILATLVLLLAIPIYIGGAIVALFLLIHIFKSASKGASISSIQSQIANKKSILLKLDNDIKRLE